jgi:hypothetical protein
MEGRTTGILKIKKQETGGGVQGEEVCGGGVGKKVFCASTPPDYYWMANISVV